LLREFEQVRADWLQNHGAATAEKLRELLGRKDFASSDPEVGARVLRLAAEVELQLNKDVTKAETLIAKADELAEPSRALCARLTAVRRGPREGAKQLETPVTLEEWNQRMALLFEAGETDAMLHEWDTPPEGIGPDAESYRLRTLALITKKELGAARDTFRKLGSKQTQTFGARFAGAVLDYFEAVSTALPEQAFQLRPHPIPVEFVKRDTKSLAGLERATATFTELALTVMPQSDLHLELQHWRLATLANHATRRAEAEEFCRTLISTKPNDAQALAWASRRNYSIDRECSVAAMAAELGIKLL
jgi:hypothetical protein